jgi:Na+/proline symporter
MKLRSMGAAYSRFGSAGVTVVPGSTFMSTSSYLAGQFIGMGGVFHVILDLPIVWTTIIGSIILILYTFMGGIVAVAWTDFIQAVLIILGLVVILPIAMTKAGGLKEAIDFAGPDFFKSFLPTHGGKGFAHYMTYLYAWLGMGLGCITEPELLQRSFIAKDSKTARRSSVIGGVMYLTLGWIPIFLGLAAISLVAKGLLPADVIADDSETIVPLIARAFLSPIPLAIFTGSLLAGLMSTGDSVLFSEAVIVANDIMPRFRKRFLKKETSEKQILKGTQWSIVILGLCSLVVALVMESLYDLMVYSYSLLFAMLWIPLTVGLFWKKANAPGAVAGMLGGLVVIVIGMIVNVSIVPEPDWAWVLGSVCASAVMTIVVTLVTQKKSPPRPLVSEDGEIVKWPELATPGMNLKPYSGEDISGGAAAK